MHARVSLHQVAMMGESTTAFIDHCRNLGVAAMTLVTPKLQSPDEIAAAVAALQSGGPRCATLNHLFAVHPDLERDSGAASAGLMQAIAMAERLGADAIYLISGGRGTLDWETAAARFAGLIGPCRDHAAGRGVRLLVENASALNVDIHMAHTLPDAIRLAEIARIGLCIELHACWMEGGLRDHFRRALPLTGLVQVSDYVLGDRSTPCRAGPGDGAIPLERLIGNLLDAGYEGLFDIELVGPRIDAEGGRAATARAAEYLSELLTRMGA
ncbi:MAG: TIM barrel protein [Novosphingobium sp.]